MRFLIGAALALFLFTPSFAAAPGCQDQVEALKELRQSSSFDSLEIISDAKIKARAIEYFNNFPPRSNNEWDTVVIVYTKPGYVLVGYGRNGDFCAHLALKPDTWLDFKHYVFGPAA